MAWRKKELINVRQLIHSTQNPTFSRIGIALLSAHFEGFIRQIANYYVIYIASQNIKLTDLCTNFVAIHSGAIFGKCGESCKVTVVKEAIDHFLGNYKTKSFRISYSPDNPIIKTHGNPSSTVVKNILESIGLDFTPYETKQNYIDRDLLKCRHSVVHGERIDIPIDDFDETFNIIINIMEGIYDQILLAAINKKYLRKSDE